MTVAGGHELLPESTDAFFVKESVNILNILNDFGCAFENGTGGQLKVIVIKAAPIKKFFKVVCKEDHRPFKKRILKNKRGVVRNADIADAKQVFNRHFIGNIARKVCADLRNFRTLPYKRMVLH